MKKNTSYILIGYTNLGPLVKSNPTFLTPIFKYSKRYFIQDIRPHFKLKGFKEITPNIHEINISYISHPSITIQNSNNGQAPIYAFRISDETILCGTRRELAKPLFEFISINRGKYTFVKLEILNFFNIFDRNYKMILYQAADMILDKHMKIEWVENHLAQVISKRIRYSEDDDIVRIYKMSRLCRSVKCIPQKRKRAIKLKNISNTENLKLNCRMNRNACTSINAIEK